MPLPAGCKAADPMTVTFKDAMDSNQSRDRKQTALSLCSLETENCCKTQFKTDLVTSFAVLDFNGIMTRKEV
jgi:hypothetical protein